MALQCLGVGATWKLITVVGRNKALPFPASPQIARNAYAGQQ
jgi:hypothetical protein